MISVVFVLSEVAAVSSSAMIADSLPRTPGPWPTATPRNTACEAASAQGPTAEVAADEARSVLRTVRRLPPGSSSRPAVAALDRPLCASRPLPVAPDVPFPAPTPAAIWPSARFTVRAGSASTAGSSLPLGRPQLSLACQAPRAANLGQQVRYRLVVRNTGDGIAEQVTVEPHVVAGTGGRNGVGHWFPVGDLAPGESREIILRTLARHAEPLHVRFFASDRQGSEAEAGVQVEVRRPAIEVTVAGPDEITLGGRAVFEIRAANTGSGAAEAVSVSCEVGDGLRLTVVDQQVQFAAKPGQLVWALGRLAGGETKTLRFEARPLVAGDQRIRVWLENTVAGTGPRATAAEKTITIRDRSNDERIACR